MSPGIEILVSILLGEWIAISAFGLVLVFKLMAYLDRS